MSKGRDYSLGGTTLAKRCPKCGGTGQVGEPRYLPEVSFKDHGGPVYSDETCGDCKGHGSTVTDAGFQLMDFVEEFMEAHSATDSVSYKRWLRRDS